jgi:hypothetical protein
MIKEVFYSLYEIWPYDTLAPLEEQGREAIRPGALLSGMSKRIDRQLIFYL